MSASLARIATAGRLLVASDYDGTLSAIVDDPERAVPDEDALSALRAIGALPRTFAAIVSGRARAELARLVDGRHEGIALVGSHGAELEAAPALSTDQRRWLAGITGNLDDIAAGYPGALVERKPAGAAFHYRMVDPDRQQRAVDAVLEGPAAHPGARVQTGRKVIEIAVLETHKGTAIAALRESHDASAVVFIGDDDTDENAFAALGPDDLGVKVGAGRTAAPERLATRDEVGPFLEELRRLREAHAEGRAGVPAGRDPDDR